MTYGTHDRRNFLKLAGAGAAGLVGTGFVGTNWIGAAFAADPRDADLVVHNARVWTVDPAMPQAEAVAIRDGRFIALGTSDAMKAMAGRATRTIDAKGMTIVPGFIDCHNHATGEVLLYQVLVGNPYEVEFVTIDSIVGKLRSRAAETPAGFWVEGFFFDDTKVKDGRLLNVHDLDKVSTEHPVAVHHRGGHTSFYNSKALAMAGVGPTIKDMPSGTYDRFPDGSLNGRVTDRARGVFANVGQRPVFSAAEKAERSRAGAAFISKKFVQYGLTGVHHQGGDLAAIQKVRAGGDLLHRVSYETSGPILDAMIADGIRTGFGDEWIRFGATSEHTIDGSYSERTMSRSTPYPGTDYHGNITEPQDVLDAWMEKVHRAGIQVNCHANGDVAIAMVMTAFERAQKLFPVKDARPKITHCTLINPDLVRRIKAAGAIPACFNTYAYYNSDKFKYYGEPLMRNMMAFRTFLDAGVPVCAGSDFSPGPFSPLMAIQAMVTRTGWNGETWGANQRVTVDEAIRINSYNGAFASREEAIKGSITPGKLADFVMLSDDPHTVPQDKIKDIRIVRTVTGGKAVYEA